LAAEAQAKAMLAQANAQKAQAETMRAQAQTAEIMAGITRDDRAQVMTTLDKLSDISAA
jgi:hypothetical protein